MADAGQTDDRLPWLDPPRPSRRTTPRPATRRARSLLLLLGLLMASAVAVTAFLAGRGSGPFAPKPRPIDTPPAEVALEPRPRAAPQPAPEPAPESAPLRQAPVALPAPIVTAPTPTAAVPTATKPRAEVERKAIRHRPVARPPAAKVDAKALPAPPPPLPYQWPAHSAAGPSGRVVQLGAYYSGRQTMAAWRRLRRAYPYLMTLPRKVTVVSPRAGHRRYYRLRIGAQSAGHARAICDNLHRIGRGCTIV